MSSLTVVKPNIVVENTSESFLFTDGATETIVALSKQQIYAKTM